jgi:hypothetical protein
MRKMLYVYYKMFQNENVKGTFLSRKWLIVNEEVVYNRLINCINITKLRNVRKYLKEIRYKREN